MANKIERRFGLWTVWNYEGEEQWLNELSKQGLHLRKAHLFWGSFVKEPAARYVYRLDYRPLSGRQLQEYITLCTDAGWAYVCSYGNGWHYFRQPWQPGESQELYTDRASLRIHYNRIRQVLGVVLLSNLLIAIPNLRRIQPWFSGGEAPEGALWWILLLQAAAVALLGYGFMRMSQKMRAISPGE